MCIGGGFDDSGQKEAAARERRSAEKQAGLERRERASDKGDTLDRRKRESAGRAVSSLAIFGAGGQDTAMRTLFSPTGGA